MVMIATDAVNTSGAMIRTTLIHSSIEKGGMNVYNAGVIHCDYVPYNACFTGVYCILYLYDAMLYTSPYSYSRIVFNQL